MSAELGVGKGELLNAEDGSSLGVRMALGETHLVRQTRTFLTSHGVAIDEFGKPEGKRSKSVILAKNLPAKTSADELRERFGKFGELGRVLLPPSGVSALIEFVEPAQAKIAFQKLAYTRFHTKPFFLEWAPDKVFSGEVTAEDKEEASATPGTSESTEEEKPVEEPPEPGTCLFVKNLNFETTDADLERRFAKIGPLASAKVATKANPKRPGQRLSMGYGFVQYRKTADAKRALKELQGALINNHAIELKQSTKEAAERGRETKAASEGKERQGPAEQGDCTKILVRNLPFQASEKEVRELFAAFGDLSSVRLPKKLGKAEHRGFGFVEFGSKAEAGKAFQALAHSTHLYGRRMVLEWAKEEETLEDVRKRTSEHFVTGENRARKGKEKRKLREALESAPAS